MPDGEAFERAELERQASAGATTMSRGFIALVFVPIVAVAALAVVVSPLSMTASVIALVLAALYTVGGTIGGIFMITAGAAGRRRAMKQLARFEERKQLPQARLIVR